MCYAKPRYVAVMVRYVAVMVCQLVPFLGNGKTAFFEILMHTFNTFTAIEVEYLFMDYVLL